MQDPKRLRRTALALRAAGLALIGGSLSAGVLSYALPASATPWAALSRVASVIVAAAAPAASASPAPAVTSKPAPALHRGGPLTFALTGSVSMGQRTQSQLSGDAGSGTLISSSTSMTTENAGLLAQLERRTATTTLQIALPASAAFRHSNLGLLQGGYYTPKYGIVYGGQPLSLLGDVPLGQTLLGFAGVLPLHGGDLTFFTGPALGINQQTLRIEGVRARMLVAQTLLEAGIDRGTAQDGTTVSALVFGAARNSGFLTHSLEVALEQLPGTGGTPSRAYSYQYNATYGSGPLNGSFTARRIAPGFVSFGSGALLRDDYVGGSLRSAFGANSIDLESAIETSGSGAGTLTDRRDALTFTREFQRSGIENMLTFTDDHRSGATGVDWTGGLSEQLGFTFDNFSTALGAQFNRTTIAGASPIGVFSYTGEVQRQFGSLNATAAYQSVRQTGDAPGLQSLASLAFTRNFGATAITFGFDRRHLIDALNDVSQSSPTITLARRISPVASLALTYGEQNTRDLANPAGNGKSRIFSVQIAAPFAIGTAVQGRVDPNLPATISGSVLNDTTGNQYSFASTVNNGVGNVAVVLDDKEVQRTDLAGHYQFNFVSPGIHEIRLESTSLPHGVTVDQPFASVAVMGGQRAQVSFRIGTYGAIAGHVMGRDANGSPVPLDNVTLTLDNTAYSRTDPLGEYSFGRLTAGTHTIAIQETSLPASVYFNKDAEVQKIAVRNGQVAQVEFQASPLGSIAGFVLFDRALAPLFSGGVNNAYVVAEPGDYAAIANEDGSFLLDNIPAGTYTVDLDPETLPDGTGNSSGPVSVTLGGNENKDGVSFTVGKKVKAVVFSFKTTEAAQATVTLSEPSLPPRGATQVFVDAGERARSVSVTVLGKMYQLAYDESHKRWSGSIVLPADAPAGKTAVTADVRGVKKDSDTSAAADLTVNPSLQLATFRVTPAKASIGQYVTVRARFLADVRPGDTIRWLDGQVTKLEHPLAGRVYVFTVKISVQHPRGLLLTRQGQVPIILR